MSRVFKSWQRYHAIDRWLGLSVLAACAHGGASTGKAHDSAQQQARAAAPGMLAMRNVERPSAKLGSFEVVDTTRLPARTPARHPGRTASAR
jgi:hypothetical protein